MAKKDNTPNDDMAAELLLKDADDALHQERLHEIWAEWGSTIIGIALMIVFGTMIGVGWKNWRISVEKAETAKLLQVQESGYASVLIPNQDSPLSGQYDAIAKMLAASDLTSTDGASSRQANAAIIHNLMVDAADGDLPKIYDTLAKWAKLRALYDAKPDSDKLQIADDMVDLANKGTNPFEALIKMEAAMIYGENSENDRAIDVLNTLEIDTSSPLNDRKTNLINLYSAVN